jgi:hypothetical protein
VLDAAVIRNDCARDGCRALGVVRRFANPPFAFAIAGISRNDGPEHTFEAADPLRVPAQHIAMRQQFRLFADCIASRDSCQAARHPFGRR